MAGIFSGLQLNPLERMVAQYIPGLVNTGLNKNQIFNSLKQYAPELNRVQSGSLVDYVRSIIRSNSNVTNSLKTKIFNSSDFPPATSTLRRNFNVKVSANVYNPETGLYEKNYITIAADSFTSKDAFLADYGDTATAYFVDYALAEQGGFVDIQSMEVFSVLRNPALP